MLPCNNIYCQCSLVCYYTISQWTGKEYKEMQQIFVSMKAGAVNDNVLTLIQAVVDFIFYAQLQVHTTTNLSALEASLALFHKNKHLLVQMGVHQHFNIPKLHNIKHYMDAICQLGSPDGYNTEFPECLHINLAKNAYDAMNKCNYTEQMMIWLQRQEAIAL
ncbi:hypothetical protein BJ165DRAFT_1563819 [Panaeolus papilionaceus]|nr:hypothetical protein BJ165DRAFT_1563819 [Panaeolus papilionaceus]